MRCVLALLALLAAPACSTPPKPQQAGGARHPRHALDALWDEEEAEDAGAVAPASPRKPGVPEIPRLKQYDEFSRVFRPPDPEPSANATQEAAARALPQASAAPALSAVPQCTWQSATALAVLLFAATSPIGIKQGWRPFVVVLVYITCLTLVKILVKLALRHGLAYPYSITTLHVLVTAVVASAFDRPQLKEAMRVLPISLANSGALAFSNTALVFSGVAFVSMLSCCTPASTCAVEIMSRRKEAAWQTGAAVLIVCAGGMLCVKGERDFSTAALILTVLSSVCRSLKCIWQHEQLQMALSPYRMVAWSGIWSLLLMIPLVVRYEGYEGFVHIWSATGEGKAAVFFSVVVAVVLNLVQCSALQYLGPLIQHVVGNLQLIMAIVLASVWLHEEVTLLQWGGVLLLVLGTMVVKAAPERPEGTLNLASIKLPAPEARQEGKRPSSTSSFPRPWLSPGIRLLTSAGTVQQPVARAAR